MLKSIINFFAPKPKPTVNASIRALVAEHGQTLRGLYILERAFLRAHGTPKGKAYIKPGGARLKYRPHRVKKTKTMLAAGRRYPETKYTVGR